MASTAIRGNQAGRGKTHDSSHVTRIEVAYCIEIVYVKFASGEIMLKSEIYRFSDRLVSTGLSSF